MTPAPPLVSIDDLHVTLGGVEILRGLKARIVRGKITALIGLNGSGKTTLLRALLKEVPYQGKIRFHCGHDHSRPQPQHIGYVPQRLLFDPNQPILVCELMALALNRRPLFLGIGKKTHKRVEEMLAKVWAPALVHRPVGTLSGGELQRVLLALALEPKPELLLLDEPAAGIDFEHAPEFYRMIADLNQQTGVTVILVSHDVRMVSIYAHHVLCLRDGNIRCEGSPQIITPDVIAEVFGADKAVFAHHSH